MTARTVLGGDDNMIPAGTTPTFKADLVDEAGVLIAVPTTVRGRIYDVKSGLAIRESFDLSTAVSGGHLIWTASPSDTVALKANAKTPTEESWH
jgi:hypothetical protein